MVTETKKSHLTKEPGVRTKLFIADETIGLGKIDLLEKNIIKNVDTEFNYIKNLKKPNFSKIRSLVYKK